MEENYTVMIVIKSALFGDAKVDIPMLEYCNVGVAVNSGGDEIKEMADYATDDVDKMVSIKHLFTLV